MNGVSGSNGTAIPEVLIDTITSIIEQARHHVRQSVNSAMVQSYWEIGRLIVEHEQQGEKRAAYGKAQLQHISTQLSARLGKGFDVPCGGRRHYPLCVSHSVGRYVVLQDERRDFKLTAGTARPLLAGYLH